MGLITSTFRQMYLIAYKYTLESKVQMITTSISELVASEGDISALGNDLDPDNPAVKQLEARRLKLNALEKKLEMQMKDYQNRIQMVDTELQSCEQAISKSIESAFKYEV